MNLVTILAIICILAILYLLVAKWKHQYWARKNVPYLTPNIIFGSTTPMITGRQSMVTFFSNVYAKAKSAGYKYYGIYNGIFPELVVIDPEIARTITTKDYVNFASHGLHHHKDDPLTDHMFNLEDKEWKERRTKLTPMFTSGKLKTMFETIEKKCECLVEEVSKTVYRNEPINIKDLFRRYTTDIIASVAFGLDNDSLKDPNNQFKSVGEKFFTPRPLNFFLEAICSTSFLMRLGYRSIPSEAVRYFTNIVKETIKYREDTGYERKDFLQLMIQLKNHGFLKSDHGSDTKSSKQYITEKEIIEEAFLMYTAGFETSSSATTFALFELAQNQEIQEKLRQEIIEVSDKSNGKISYDAVNEMEYLDKVFKETLRKYPVVSILPRKCSKRYQLPGTNLIIEAGTKVYIPVVGIQNDPEFYPNPDQFNPENFSPESKASRPDSTYIPFGDGPRKCIGLRLGIVQAKMALCAVLKNFKFTIHESTKPPYETDVASIVYSFKQAIHLVGSPVQNVM